MRYTADDAPNMWNIQYNVIRRANRLIEAVDNKTITDAENFQAELANIYNQAKVIRALVHFDLVKVYGMPIHTMKVLRLEYLSLTNHWIVMHNPDVTR